MRILKLTKKKRKGRQQARKKRKDTSKDAPSHIISKLSENKRKNKWL